MGNYGDLKTKFLGLLNRRDITPTQTAGFLQDGISRCQRELRIPAMEKGVVATIADGYNGLLIPSDYLELIDLFASDGIKLKKRDIQTATRAARTAGPVPRIYCRQGGKWLLGPSPLVGDTVRIDYYAEFAPLVDDTDTNILTKIASDLAAYAGLSYAGDHFEDDRQPAWEATYERILGELNDQKLMDEVSDAAVQLPEGVDEGCW